jgi:hypothetical protein
VADPGFMTEIGQSDFHRSQRRQQREGEHEHVA